MSDWASRSIILSVLGKTDCFEICLHQGEMLWAVSIRPWEPLGTSGWKIFWWKFSSCGAKPEMTRKKYDGAKSTKLNRIQPFSPFSVMGPLEMLDTQSRINLRPCSTNSLATLSYTFRCRILHRYVLNYKLCWVVQTPILTFSSGLVCTR